MKLPLDLQLTDMDDTPATEKNPKTREDEPVTIRKVLIRGCLSEADDDQRPVRGEEKIKRYDLYRAIKKAKEDTEFSIEDVAALRKIALIFPPLVAGQLREALNG